jgi:hypothetical protein
MVYCLICQLFCGKPAECHAREWHGGLVLVFNFFLQNIFVFNFNFINCMFSLSCVVCVLCFSGTTRGYQVLGMLLDYFQDFVGS